MTPSRRLIRRERLPVSLIYFHTLAIVLHHFSKSKSVNLYNKKQE